MRDLLEQGQWERAYALGNASPDLLGDPEFDFYFGVAAINAGHPGAGLLALERYVLAFPDNRSARFQLARAYLLVGEDGRARDEFEALLIDARDAERAALMAQLEVVRQREGRYRATANVYVDAGLGHDNNVNAGIAAGSVVTIPGLGTLPPLAGNAALARGSSLYRSVGFSAQGAMPLQPGLKLDATASIDQRSHFKKHADVFDLGSYGLGAGLAWTVEDSVYRAQAQWGGLEVDGQRYVNSLGLGGEYLRVFGAHDQVKLAANLAQTTYQRTRTYPTWDQSTPPVLSNNQVRDADILALSARWNHLYADKPGALTWFEVNHSREDNRRGREDLSRNIYGASFGARLALTQSWAMSATFGRQRVRYQEAFLPGAARRADWFTQAELEASCQLTRDARLSLSYNRGEQDSNIGLFSYGRDVLAMKLRYQLM
jgi:hypothetical protein